MTTEEFNKLDNLYDYIEEQKKIEVTLTKILLIFFKKFLMKLVILFTKYN